MKSKEIVTRVGKHLGGMSMFIDDEVQPFTYFKITETPDSQAMLDAAEIEIPAMAKNGINLCWVPLFLKWSGTGEYDFTDFDRRVRKVLELYDANTPAGMPKAYVGIRLQAAVFHPQWYIDEHLDANGDPTNLIEFRNPWGRADGGDNTTAISPGDEFWDTHALDCLKTIVAHVRSSDYAHRVFGWLPCAFNTNEWFIRTFVPGAVCDFSQPSQQAFKSYLEQQGISCFGQPVPSPLACQTPGCGEFLTADGEGGIVEEFSKWLNNRMANIILNFAGTIKALYKDSPKIVGFFYGYSTELSFFQNLSQSGHLGLRKIIDSNLIDFLCSPCQYRFRRDEGVFTYNMTLGPFADSGALRGKLVFAEDDHFPVFARTTNTDCSTRDKWHDEMFFRRNFAQVMASGQQMWWYSLGASWFKEPYRNEIIGSLHRVGLEALQADRSPVGEVAVVVDERSVQTMRLNAPFQSRLILESLAGFSPTGAPVECHELNSFLDYADHSRYKVVVFLNLFLTDQAIRDKVDKLKSDNRTLMFFFAPGLLEGDTPDRKFSLETAGHLVGMNLFEVKDDMPLSIWMDPDRVDLMADEDIRFGWLNPEIPVKPIIGISDPDATALGFLHTDIPGFALKRHTGWTSIFSAVPNLPSRVLKSLLKNAGVHLYTDSEDVIYANRSMIAYVACSRGEKELIMRNAERLEDVISGEQIQLENGRCRMFMKRHETRIFRIKK